MMVQSSHFGDGNEAGLMVVGLIGPVAVAVLFIALCIKRYKADKTIIVVNSNRGSVSMSPVTGFNQLDTQPLPNSVQLSSNDLFATKASLPRLPLPLNSSYDSRQRMTTSAYQGQTLSPGDRTYLMQPDTPPSIIITNTDSLSFNLAHQKLINMTTIHPLAVPTTDTVMATLLADIFLTKVTRSVETGKTAEGGSIYKGVWQGAPVILYPLVTDKLRQLRDDVIILKNLRHPNIVIFFGLYQFPGEGEINIVTEWMEHGNLKEFLKSHSPDYVYKQQMVLLQRQKEIEDQKQQQQEEMPPVFFTISSPQYRQQIQMAAKGMLPLSKDPTVENLDLANDDHKVRPVLMHSHSQSELISPFRAVPGGGAASMPMLSSRDLVKLSRDIAAGMMQLEQKSFAHKNLSATSILVGGSLPGNLLAKLSDFGLNRHTEIVPSPRWMPPEALQTKKFTTRSDLWSYGVCLYEIFSYGKLPYEDMPENQILGWVLEGNRLHFNSSTPPIVQTIAYRCWDLNPARRPTFDEIFELLDNYLRSPYFN